MRLLPELLATARPIPQHDLTRYSGPTQWGPWSLNLDGLTLDIDSPSWPGYAVRLDECTSGAAVLDWIANADAHFEPAAVGHLVHALDDLLGLIPNLCGGGENMKVRDVAGLILNRRG